MTGTQHTRIGPRLTRLGHGALTLFWLAMVPVSIVLGWIESIPFAGALAVWAVVSGRLLASATAAPESPWPSSHAQAALARDVAELKRSRR
jgi:hypothetical protein